jgi:hypothetical protein
MAYQNIKGDNCGKKKKLIKKKEKLLSLIRKRTKCKARLRGGGKVSTALFITEKTKQLGERNSRQNC